MIYRWITWNSPHDEEVELFRYELFSKTLETTEEPAVESRPTFLIFTIRQLYILSAKR
jgi:hypothetical protein